MAQPLKMKFTNKKSRNITEGLSGPVSSYIAVFLCFLSTMRFNSPSGIALNWSV